MAGEAGQVQIEPVAFSCFYMQRVALFLAGRPAVYINNAVSGFLWNTVRPDNSGFIVWFYIGDGGFPVG